MFIHFLCNTATRADEYLGNAIEPFCACLIGERRELAFRLAFAKKPRVGMLKLLFKADLLLALLAKPAGAVVIKKLQILHTSKLTRMAVRNDLPLVRIAILVSDIPPIPNSAASETAASTERAA